jgi:hypothetical protein
LDLLPFSDEIKGQNHGLCKDTSHKTRQKFLQKYKKITLKNPYKTFIRTNSPNECRTWL